MTSDVGYAQRTDYPDRMREIQLAFIDDPRGAARDADALVEDLVRSLVAELEQRRSELNGELNGASADAPPQTEQLRQTVRRYRELVDALVHTREEPRLPETV